MQGEHPDARETRGVQSLLSAKLTEGLPAVLHTVGSPVQGELSAKLTEGLLNGSVGFHAARLHQAGKALLTQRLISQNGNGI